MDVYVKIPILEEKKLKSIKKGEQLTVHFVPFNGLRAAKVTPITLDSCVEEVKII